MFRNRLFYVFVTLALVLVTALTIRSALAAPTVISGDAHTMLSGNRRSKLAGPSD